MWLKFVPILSQEQKNKKIYTWKYCYNIYLTYRLTTTSSTYSTTSSSYFLCFASKTTPSPSSESESSAPIGNSGKS